MNDAVNAKKRRPFYGWWVVAGGFLLMATCYAVFVNCIPLFQAHVVQDMGMSVGQFNTGTALCTIVALFASLAIGKLIDVWDVRILGTITVLVAFAVLIALSAMGAYWQFLLCCILAGIVVVAGTRLLASVVVANWFTAKRGLAVSIALAGSGAGGASSSGSMSGSSSAAAPAAAPADGDGWMTRLVNAANPLPEGFTVETVDIRGYENRPFDKRAAADLEAMLADAEAAGCKLYLVSGYRSVERQTALFKRKTNSFMAEGFSREEAEKQAAMWVARPGTSEHNTGLAADIVSADWYSKHSDLTADFEDTPEFEWLYAHCADYGFILRYPRGKENVTGVTYEPWHYRYVGKDAAKAIMQAGGTLEEYTGAHTA